MLDNNENVEQAEGRGDFNEEVARHNRFRMVLQFERKRQRRALWQRFAFRIGEFYDCVEPLFDETIRPEGMELVVTRSPSPDAIAEGKRFYDAHGYIPANHLYMVRGSLARQHPALIAKPLSGVP